MAANAMPGGRSGEEEKGAGWEGAAVPGGGSVAAFALAALASSRSARGQAEGVLAELQRVPAVGAPPSPAATQPEGGS